MSHTATRNGERTSDFGLEERSQGTLLRSHFWLSKDGALNNQRSLKIERAPASGRELLVTGSDQAGADDSQAGLSRLEQMPGLSGRCVGLLQAGKSYPPSLPPQRVD